MLRGPAFPELDVRPGPSSQTTTSWPLLLRLENGERVIAESVSLDAGGFSIQPARQETWDEVMEKVLRDRADAWERLAAL